MNQPAGLELTDELLKEWAWFFRDRVRLERCRSIEHRYRATSEDFAAEGWGDMDAAPRIQPARSYKLLLALETHEIIQSLDRLNKWALTYGFCYPHLPRFVVLRCMKKFTGKRLTWTGFSDLLYLARCRVHARYRSHRDLTLNKSVARVS